MIRQLMTQSAAAMFRDCRKKAELRHERGLVPMEEAHELRFGHLIHGALEAHHTGVDPFAHINQRALNPTDQALALAMMRGYVARYPSESFEAVAVEQEFRIEIRNPDTNAASRSFEGAGKIDAIIRKPDGLWLMEHKTTGRIDSGYLERLWIDFQIAWYCIAIEEVYQEPVVGILYNVLEKTAYSAASQEQGETDAEWNARLAMAKAPGRCKRVMPESDEAYRARLDAIYADGKKFHREEILLVREDLDLVRAEMWDLTQAWLDARKNNRWYRNTSQCFHYNKPCQYLPICKSRENPMLIEALYKRQEPHAELLPF